MTEYIIDGFSLPFDQPSEEAVALAAKKLRRADISASRLRIYRKSIDARKRDDIRFVYSVIFTSENALKDEVVRKNGLRPLAGGNPDVKYGSTPLAARPVVAGMGPCGMFSALLLAENGYRPIVLERGGNISDRVAAVDRFYRDGILDENSNIQFGAGGAGTFSDGKLVTRINDKNCNYVLSKFASFGAPKEILTLAKPHIGTDILRNVVENIANEIVRLGGEIRYNTSLLSFDDECGGTRRLHTTGGDIDTSALILAIGHSARDTYKMLIERGSEITAKDFSVGLRIEHRKSDIDRALYGKFAGRPELPYGEYNLSCNTKVRGVYTFCMCPGGEVVASSSERGGLCVNGMSSFARDGENSNSAVCVSVFGKDYGETPWGAVEFQRRLEQAAFEAGGKNYFAPACTVEDFLNDRSGIRIDSALAKVRPTYRGGKVSGANLRALFPKELGDTLAMGITDFGRKIRGFDAPDALLTGVETRTSAPLRILRGDALTMNGTSDIYPGGEGAGYAGGITSAAVDGVRIALAVMEKYKPIDA